MSVEGKRLFVGVRVSVGTANALADAVETLARRAGSAGHAVRWVPPTLYHVTLKFLGLTQPEAISALQDGLRAAVLGVAPFSFSVARLGAFPELGKARVIWAGVSSVDDALGKLARRVDDATSALGFAGAAGSAPAFVGHVTLGRLREPVAISEVLLPLMEQMFSDTKVAGISLLESVLKSGTLTYRELAHFGFSSSEIGRKRQSLPLQLGPQDAPTPASSSGQPSIPSAALDLETDDGWPRGHVP
ncbi:MAG: RNA 2',3'-cyclic phosphodiesterase [Myxococcales bacterium]|nr:RNA 2',3'-cyclic phosphodiesterase [Myxococcales bacterium]